MARGRPHGRSKSDHRVCQEARHARAAEYRERITISAEQQEARIAAVNAQCDVQDAPQKRRSQKSSGRRNEAWTGRGSAQHGSCKASGNAKKKAKQRLGETLGKAAERDMHSLSCHACGALAEFGLRGGKEGGSVKYMCRAHATSNGCFRIDRDRAEWAGDREMRRLRAEERRLQEELQSLGGISSNPKTTSAGDEFQSTGVGASMPMSRSLIATLLMIGGIESNPGPAGDKGSPYKGDLALPGRTSTDCSKAPGSIVESDGPLNLLPSLETLNPTRLEIAGDWRAPHVGRGLDPLAGLLECGDNGGQTVQLHLRLRGGADDDPMDQVPEDEILVKRQGTTDSCTLEAPASLEAVLEHLEKTKRWGKGALSKWKNGREVDLVGRRELGRGEYIFKAWEGAGPSTSGDPGKGQLRGNPLRISGTGEWSPAIADAIRQALDPTFRLLDSEGNLPIPCWTPPPEHPQAVHISRLAIPQWRGEPSLLLHDLPEKGKGKGRSAADRLIAFILETRAKYAGQQTQLGRATFGLGVSGCGKTRTDLEALCGPWYGFYLSFSTAEEPGSNVLAAAVERFEGRFQGELTKLLEAGNQEGLKSYRRERLQDARKLVIRILLVEVLCLERFLMEYGEAATPRKYLMMQLIGLGKLEDWLVDAWSCVFDVSLEELKKELQRAVDHVKQLTEQDFLLVVVDEAHLGLKSLEDHFPNADNTEGRSLLNAWVRILNDAAFKGFHFLFTGTRLGMAEHDSLATAIGKGPGVPVIFSDYGINSTSQAKSFAMEYVPGDDCEDLLSELVAGRYRFAVELTKLRLADARLNWEGAANALKKRHTGDASSQRTLIGRLTALESKGKFYKNILHSLKVLVTDRYVMGVARAQYRKDLDLVELGFCHLVRVKDDEADENEEEGGPEIDESKGLWRMDMSEPLAAVAAKVYLERRGGWKQDSVVERLMLKLDLPSPIGLLWDVYMPTALRKFFTPDKKLADHPLLKSIKGRLPASFFTHPQIVCLTKDGTVNKVTDREGYKVRRWNEGFRFVDFAEDPRSITSFLPEDGAGPDVAHFVQLGEAKKENWFDILQAKLRPDYDLEHALKTVTLDLLYSGHPDREQLVARVKSALKEKRVKGVIRFVAAFPSTKTATTEVFHPEESKTRKEDMCTVQIGVSAENAHHFFGEEHLEILRSLKDVKKRAYSEIE